MLREPARGGIHPLPAESSRTYVSGAVAQARQLLYPSGNRQKLGYLATGISGTPHGAASAQLFTGGQEAVGSSYLPGDPEPPSRCSLLPPHLTRNGDALSLSRCRAFSLSSGKPQCCLPGCVWWSRRWREREARQGLSTAASHRIGILSPSPVK